MKISEFIKQLQDIAVIEGGDINIYYYRERNGDVVTCFCGLNLQRFGNALEIRAGSDWVKTKIEKLRAESQLEAMTTDREAMRAELAAMTAERDSLRMVLKGIQEIAAEDIRLDNITSQTCVWQVEANARAALA